MKIEYCSRCTLPNTYPGSCLREGVCTYCRDTELRQENARTIALGRAREEMLSLFAALRGSACFDCVMCYSGGKDSTYVLGKLVKTYNLKPLVLTIDNGFITPVAKSNIDRMTSLLGVEHHFMKIDWGFMKQLILTSVFEDIAPPKELKRISSLCSSCIFLVNTIAIKYAMRFQIPLIIAGFTPGQVPAPIYGNRLVAAGGGRKGRLELLRKHLGERANFYFEIEEDDNSQGNPYPIHVNPLLTEPYSEERVLERIAELGWQRPTDTGRCSTNCVLNCLGTYVHFSRHSFSPYARETAELVRAGALSYARGKEVVQDVAFNDSVRQCLKRLDISEDEFLARLGEKCG